MSKRDMQITNRNILLEETIFIFKMSKSQTCVLTRRFKKTTLDMTRFTPNEVNFLVTHEGHQNCSKTCFMNILNNFGELHV